MDTELSERFNDGVVSAPDLEGVEYAQMQPPDWQPSTDQLQQARQHFKRNSLLLSLLVCAVLVLITIGLGWRP